MDIFYFVLFGAAGIFCILAAVLDLKWYVNYRADRSRRSRTFVRVCTGLTGALLLIYGVAVLVGWL